MKYQRKQFTCKITIKNEVLTTCYYTSDEAILNDNKLNMDFINNETLRMKDKEVLLHELRNHISKSIVDFLKQKDIELKGIKQRLEIIRD